MSTALRNLRVKRVDLVDLGASQDPAGGAGAHVVLFKRAEEVDVDKAEWTAASINDLPDGSFAVVEGGGKKDDEGKTVPRSLRHLPFKDKDGKVDLPHLRNALARLPQTGLSDDLKARAKEKLDAAAKEHGVGEVAKEKPGGPKPKAPAMDMMDAEVPAKAKDFEEYHKGYDPAVETPSGGKFGAHVFEMPNQAEHKRFLEEVPGSAPHPDGGTKAVLPAPAPKRKPVGKADLEELPRRVRTAFGEQFNRSPYGPASYVTTVDSDFVIACISDFGGEKFYKIPWKEGADGAVSFDMAGREEVQQDWVAKATSFAEALMNRQMDDMTEDLGDAIGAFYEAVQSIIGDEEIDDKPEAVKGALVEFSAAVKDCIEEWVGDGGGVEKVGRKISASRLKRLKEVKGHIDAIINEAEGTSAWDGKRSRKPAPVITKRGGGKMDIEKILEGVAADAREGVRKAWNDLTGKVQKLTEDLEAARAELSKGEKEPEDIWKGVHPDIKKAHQDLAKRAEAAETLAKAERDERLKGVYISKAAAFKSLPVNPDDDWKLLKAVDERLEPGQAKRVVELLKAADEALAQSKLFGEVGRPGVPTAGSAEEKINKLAEDFLAKSAKPITIEQARVRVMEMHPELYAEHVRETRGEE